VAPDLTPLEQAAAKVGLNGLRARVVPPDPRRGTWFRWDERAGELEVSERVLDRCVPNDASALLMNDVLLARRMSGVRRMAMGGVVLVAVLVAGAVALTAGTDGALRVLGIGLMVFLPLLLLIAWLGARVRAAFDADDETVRLLGDAEPLVRGLNCMNQDEVVIGRFRSAARPDLHKRAERLVGMHGLCSARGPDE
jgi:hypothetical protein